jgi:hypothetical protein
MATKKLDVPDIGGLLGKITEKREELPKAPIQSVQPVEEKAAESKNGGTLKQQNSIPANQPQSQPEPPPRGAGGRPSVKKDSIVYVKISPRIPKALKRDVDIALIDERFKDAEKNPIKTLDEIVAYALDRLLK